MPWSFFLYFSSFLWTGFICCGILNSDQVVQIPHSQTGDEIPFNQESRHDRSSTNALLGDIAAKLAVATKIPSKRPLGIKQ